MAERGEGEGNQKSGELKRRLKSVRRRKQARRRLEGDAVALKVRLVETRGRIDR